MTDPTTPPLVEGDFRTKQAIQSALPVNVAEHVLWHFGDPNLGLQPGDFVIRLLRLLEKADQENRDLLATIYPDYTRAFRAVQNEVWGLEWLRSVARDRLTGVRS